MWSYVLTFDSNGNTTKDDTGKQFVYDAWNRLAIVKTSGGTTIASYSYDPLGRRITRSDSVYQHMFYNGRQMIEERDNPYSPTTVAQNVWSLAYTDALVLRDTDADLSTASGSYGKTSSGLEVRQYVMQDANWNVTGIVNTSGNVIERYKYDPYGAVTVLNGASDHDAGVSDWSADADNTSDWKWVYYFQGLWWDGDAKLLRADDRDLSVTLGRWMQEDPLRYVDGMSVYEYVQSSPIDSVDPYGLEAASGLTSIAYVGDPKITPYGAEFKYKAQIGNAIRGKSGFQKNTIEVKFTVPGGVSLTARYHNWDIFNFAPDQQGRQLVSFTDTRSGQAEVFDNAYKFLLAIIKQHRPCDYEMSDTGEFSFYGGVEVQFKGQWEKFDEKKHIMKDRQTQTDGWFEYILQLNGKELKRETAHDILDVRGVGDRLGTFSFSESVSGKLDENGKVTEAMFNGLKWSGLEGVQGADRMDIAAKKLKLENK
jgi:RHS repeat-associated protein